MLIKFKMHHLKMSHGVVMSELTFFYNIKDFQCHTSIEYHSEISYTYKVKFQFRSLDNQLNVAINVKDFDS